ncbi:hypothetical protein F4780DRAFT_170116 [Xylariomycetidae sp. FL0641]|nr:hypothetical protein F4780DRAFT_170116 [Xylariomycetidae sp. FL0641]
MAMMQTADARAPAVRSHDMACILFTSGSSRPGKAISYSHGALATACAGQGPTLRINPSSRVMQLSSFSSDVSLSEVLTTLVNGGCVCVPSAAERVADLPRACRRMGVNWIALTPSLSRKLSPETLPNLSVVCFRARRLDRDVYASFVGKVQVLLVYGSAAACPLGLAAAKVNATSPVQTFGRPFCGNFWIVSPDDHNRLVPVGGVGELVIGGPTLASAVDIHGQDVKALQHSNRLLKTGHLARYRGEAEIEFVTGDSERPEGGDRVPNGQGQVAGMKPLPLTRTEKLMRGIWAEVLGLESDSIGAETGFLSAGGDMVTARRLVIACRQRGIAVSIDNLLRDASVSRLCRDITAIETPTISQADADEGERSPLDTFVDEAIAPRLSSHGAMIEDVAEASSLQTTFIESAMLETRGNISYFVANFSEQAVDWQRLRNACYMLTKAHPILRTAFVAHSRQVFQTVLRSHKPEFTRYQCQGWRLSNLVTKLVKEDRTLPLDFRRPFTKFFFLDAGKTSTLVMRLSRAQYDESSIPTLFLDLDQFYRRGDRSSYKIDTQPLGYCDFIRAAYSKNQSDNGPYGHSTSNLDNSTYNRSTYRAGIEYWRTLLEDAAMTQIVSQPSIANGGGASSRTIRQQTSVGSLQGLGVPFETVLKGAWSIVLSMLSKANDVVFGQLVEGNNLGLAGGQFSGIVGPKANVIPVRTRIPAVMITPYEYFHCIQSQHIASVSHENVQTADIVQKCTSWPAYTRFSSVVYHQTSAEERFTYCVLGNASCKVDLITSNAQSSDMFIQTVFTDCDTVEVSLTFCDAHLASLAEEALRRLCSMLSNMTSKFVMEPRHLKEAAPTRIHLPLPAPKAEATRLLSAHLVDPDRAHAVHELITTAWEKVLDVNTKDFADIRSMPYYQLWGSLIMPAAELARYYTTKVPKLASAEATALPITTEDIIRHPTMMQQYELIIAKQQPASLGVRHSRSFAVRTHTAWGKNFRKLTIGRKPSRASEGSVESMTMESSNDEDDWPLTPPAPANAPNDKDKDKKLRGHRHTISLRETMR